MLARLFAFMLLLCPLLDGQQKPQPKAFKDCDKTARTQADLNECASSDAKSADDELNKTYQQLLKKATGDPVALQKIRAAQKAWVAFRDAQIAALYPSEDKQQYGSAFSMCADLDLANLTRQRTKMLKEMLNPVEGDVCH
ncbi:MAG: lysozyme inhibitor LprI family protein [Terriglobales bacterium]